MMQILRCMMGTLGDGKCSKDVAVMCRACAAILSKEKWSKKRSILSDAFHFIFEASQEHRRVRPWMRTLDAFIRLHGLSQVSGRAFLRASLYQLV